jgi:hypothetical protein
MPVISSNSREMILYASGQFSSLSPYSNPDPNDENSLLEALRHHCNCFHDYSKLRRLVVSASNEGHVWYL